jgi:hypothetical protein
MRIRSLLLNAVVAAAMALGACAQGVVGLNPTPLGVYQWNATSTQFQVVPNSYNLFPLQSPPQPIAFYGWNASLGQWAPCTTAGSCPNFSGPQLSIEHNSSAAGILQTPLNFCDNGTCGQSVPSGMQQVIFGPDASGGWSAWTANATNQLTTFTKPPISGQHIIVYPTAHTVSACGTSNSASADNQSGSVVMVGSGSCGPSSVGWTFNTSDLPAGVPIANVTAAYPFVVSGSSINNNTGAGNEFDTVCTGTGVTLHNNRTDLGFHTNVSYPLQTYMSSTSLTVSAANFNAMTCSITASMVDSGVGGNRVIKGNATLVGAYVYYTGTPVTQPAQVYVPPALNFNPSTSTLSLPLPYDASVDFGTADLYATENDAFTNLVGGLKVTFCALNQNGTTTPTLNLNGWGALPIVGPTGAAVAAHDIADCPTTGVETQVILGGNNEWFLQNPQVSGGGGGTTTNSLTAASTGGAAPGTAFNGSVARTYDYHSFGAVGISGTPVTGNCPEWASANTLGDTGSPCGTGGGGGVGPGTVGFIPSFNTTTTVGNSHVDDGATTSGQITSTEPFNLAASGTPSQLSMTYSGTALIPGSSTTAVYGVDSSGKAVVSEAGGAASETCTAANGVCAGAGGALVTITGSLTPTNCTISSGVCTVGTATATVTLSGIPATYHDLVVTISGSNTTTVQHAVLFQFNGDVGANYSTALSCIASATCTITATTGVPAIDACITGATGLSGGGDVVLPNYASAKGKIADGLCGGMAGSPSFYGQWYMGGYWSGTAAITSITFTLSTGSFESGTTFIVRGRN